MRSRSGRLTLTHTALLTGLLTMAGVTAAHAQDKAAAPGATPAASAPAAPAAKDAAKDAAKKDEKVAPTAKDAAKKDEKAAAKDAKKDEKTAAAPPAKPLTEKQKKDEAKKSFKEGEGQFEKGEFAAAVESYKRADEMLPGLNPKYKLAASLDKLNKVTEAVAAYQTFLDAVDGQIKADKKFDPKKVEDKVKDAQSRIEALKKTPATVKLAIAPETAQNVQITVDGQPATATGNTLSLAPGKHTIAFSAEGFEPATQEVEVKFAETKDLPVQLTEKPKPVAEAPPPPPVEPEAPAAPPPPPPPPPKSYVPAYVTLGLAGVGAVVGTIFGVSALSAKSEFEKTPTIENADRTDRNALISDMSFAVALTFGVTGAVLLFSDDKPAEQTTARIIQKPVIAPWVGPTGGGATASFRF